MRAGAIPANGSIMQEQTQVTELAVTQIAGDVEAEKKGKPQSNGIKINRFNHGVARREWKKICGDLFKYRGKFAPSFKQFLKARNDKSPITDQIA